MAIRTGVPDPPPRNTPAAVIHLMRLANAAPVDGARDLRSGLIQLAVQMNSKLPAEERVLVVRDCRCRKPFPGVPYADLVHAAYVAVGAYIEDEAVSERRRTRTSGYLMLERYFVYAQAMWEEAVRHGQLADERQETAGTTSALESEVYRTGAFVGYWLAALCPVIEGWEELKLHDEKIDALLADGSAKGYRDRLFRFRNGMFHFQRREDDPRFSEFMDEAGEARLWAAKLESAFERFFRYHNERGYMALTEWLTR